VGRIQGWGEFVTRKNGNEREHGRRAGDTILN